MTRIPFYLHYTHMDEKPKKKTLIKLTKESKKRIVHDLLLRYPLYKHAGWNQRAIELMYAMSGVKIHDSYMSKLKKEAIQEIKELKHSKLSKAYILEMWFDQLEYALTPADKRACLIEIGKLNEVYKEDVEIHGSTKSEDEIDLTNLSTDQLKQIRTAKRILKEVRKQSEGEG